VVRLHGSHTYFAIERGQVPSARVRWLEDVALRQADAWLAGSRYTAERTERIFGFRRPLHVLYNAVHVPSTFPRKESYAPSHRAVYFGTLAEKKGVLALASAWRNFHASHPDWSLTVIGRDTTHHGRSVRDAMGELAGDAVSSMTFTGPLSNEAVLSHLPAYDFAVLPSFSETFSLAPMEAMALGLPVVFSQLSSGPELIEHGVNGWLADPRDPEQLARLIADVADNADRQEEVGRAGRALIERSFSHEAFIESNLAVYRQIGLSASAA
jgi:glycosyltransferase involved in cell wall biosynthesis